ncbi:MAG: sigma-70 family RNA polymerase sigma factor [Fuerstiella sp.]
MTNAKRDFCMILVGNLDECGSVEWTVPPQSMSKTGIHTLMEHDTPESPDEQFVQMLAGHERQLRAFIRSMGLDWSAVDDVVQTVSLVMWRKWDEFDPDTDFMPRARVIARFEVLKFRRRMARDRHVFRDDVMELLAHAAEELDSQASAEDCRAALQHCLNSLPRRSGQLIRAAYEGDRTIREIAEDVGQSATAFYKTLDRIREKLRMCIKHRVESSQ